MSEAEAMNAEVPEQIKGLTIDVADSFAQIVNEVMRYAAAQSGGGPGGHTVAVVAIAAAEMVIDLLLEHYAKDDDAKVAIRALALRIKREAQAASKTTVQRIESEEKRPN